MSDFSSSRGEHQSTGGLVIPTPGRPPLALGLLHWSFKYYGLKIHMCGMREFELASLATPYL